MSLPDTTLRLLKIELSDKELKSIAWDLTENLKEVDRLEDETKAMKAQYKASIEEHIAKANLCRQKFRDGYEMRNVECSIERNFETNEKKLTRIDTKEVIESGAIPTDERQMLIGESGPVELEKEDEKTKKKGK